MELKNDLLLRTLKGESVERPPVWLMRQAGRILPQYRALRASLSGFIELVRTPDLAAEVTIQPVDELAVDAAIIFSDILVIPEAMGLPYEMVEKRGPLFPETIESSADIERLTFGEDAAAHLQYVYDAISITQRQLAGRVPLIGFCGAPWTILSYMVEGSGSKTFSKARKFLVQQPTAAHQLLDKITQTSIAYLRQKVAAGVQVLQIFDSWAGILSPQLYQTFALPYIRQICEAIPDTPKIVFAKGAWFALPKIAELPCEAVGFDWNIDPQWGRGQIGDQKIAQGNLDPCILYSDFDTIATKTEEMLQNFGSKHIVNLGHGVYPDTPLEHVRHFINCAKNYRYQ